MAKRITNASAKAKGRRLQNWAAKRIGWLLNLPVGKDEVVAPREMGQSGVDVRLVGEAKVRFPFAVECKAQEAWRINDWIDQARNNESKDTAWLLFAKRNRQEPVAIMDAETFFNLMQMCIDLQKKGKNEKHT